MEVAKETKMQLKNWLGNGSINIFGRPFSGKDTQANLLANVFDCSVIGGGDIIRNSKHNYLRDDLKSGLLTPQDEYLKLVLPFLSLDKYTNKPLILSSLGRWHGEEPAILNAANESNHTIKAVIHLNIPEPLVYDRWQAAKELGDRGTRNDDNSNSIKTRLHEYLTKTIPVIEYYKKLGLLIEIDGTKSRNQVSEMIINKLVALVVKQGV